MRGGKEKINAKLIKLGKSLELDSIDSIKAKKTIRNVVTMAIFTGAFLILGSIMMPGGPAGLYYTGASIKDFRMLFGSLF